MSELPQVLVIENGSQTTLRIPNVCNKNGVRAMVLPPKRAEKLLESGYRPKLVILSGGLASVSDSNAPKIPKQLLKLKQKGVPIHTFGICYGMQKIAEELGGSVESALTEREYGRAKIQVLVNSNLFQGCAKLEDVWMSHGDTVTKVPPGFRVTAQSETGAIAAFQNDEGTIAGVQFHPEVDHTPNGNRMIANLLWRSGCEKDWQPSDMIFSIQYDICSAVGKEKVILGMSGGVDSTTLGRIASVLGKQLRGIIIDLGQFREGEIEEAKRHAEAAGIKCVLVNRAREFLRAVRHVEDGEKLRKLFEKFYLRILKAEAKKFGAKFVLQGTLAPDLIESGATGGAKIKSHHNVGLNFGKHLKQLHPLGNLFKYEVRELARKLGLPKSVWARQPFPGPGEYLRILGKPATSERLATLRWADARVTEILKKHGWYNRISQLVVALNCTEKTAVKGDARVYAGVIEVRAVKTFDFLTAEGIWFPKKVVKEICSVLTKHPKIAGVLFDPTDKPPRTVENR